MSPKHLVCAIFPLVFAFNAIGFTKNVQTITEACIQAHGGKEKFYKLRDVQYRLVVKDPKTGNDNISTEKYLFDGERSRGDYSKYSFPLLDALPVPFTEIFDGTHGYWKTSKGWEENESSVHRRKMYYFRFSLPFKLLDHGLALKWQSEKRVSGQMYDVIDATFDEGFGPNRDRFRLFINQRTKRLDRYLFTMKFQKNSMPFLMTCRYSETAGIQVAVERHYQKATWEGIPLGPILVEETTDQVNFWNGFEKKDFAATPRVESIR